MINLKKNIKPERFVMHQEDIGIAKVENLAKHSGCTKSWIYRAVLHALLLKYPKGLPENIVIKRPKKFKKKFRQTTICFYGDRQKWFSLAGIWNVELGPLIRYGLELFERGELDLDLDSSISIKKVKKSDKGNMRDQEINSRRFIYMYQNKNSCYSKDEFWVKNQNGNLRLMELGLTNRIYKLRLPENFIIPKCFF